MACGQLAKTPLHESIGRVASTRVVPGVVVISHNCEGSIAALSQVKVHFSVSG